MTTNTHSLYSSLILLLCLSVWSCDFALELKPVPPVPDAYSNILSLDSLALRASDVTRFSRDSLSEFNVCYVDEQKKKIYLKGNNYSLRSHSRKKNFEQRFYRLNSNGEVEDSLVFAADSTCLVYGPYLVNYNSVFSWMKDGKREGVPIVVLNQDLDLDSTERAVYELELHSKSSVAVNRSVYRKRKSYQSSFFIVDNIGYDVLEGNSLRWDSTAALPVKDFLMDDWQNWFSVPHDSVFAGKNAHIAMRYFHKEKFHKQHSNGAFNPISQTIPAKWEGKAFMDLALNNAAWSFYIPMNQLERDSMRLEQKRRVPIQFYSLEEMGIAIFGLNDGKLYFFNAK